MNKNLHLQFKFIDRAGREVYEIFAEDDNKRLKNPLGEVRVTKPDVESVRWSRVVLLADQPETRDIPPVQLELPLEGGE